MCKRFLCLLFCLVFSFPAYAQWGRFGLSAGWRDLALQLQRAGFNQSYLKKVLGEKSFQKTHASLPMELEKSVFTLMESGIYTRRPSQNIIASAFIFEENYNGKKHVWGMTAHHYHFIKPTMLYKKGKEPVSFVAQGTSGMNDLVLFPIPPEIAKTLKPIPLANKNPEEGEELFSIGFFQGQFHVETNRTVQKANNQRIITNLPNAITDARAGACGGPVLNNKGELVGVHVGSSHQYQIGFVVPLNRIRQLLRAYYSGGNAPEDLFFNNQKIGKINVNQHIFAISLYKNDHFVRKIPTFHREEEMDYNHLEKWVKDVDVDFVVFEIYEGPFSMEEDSHPHTTYITYYPANGKVITKSFDPLEDPNAF